jgi:hypothetical protein
VAKFWPPTAIEGGLKELVQIMPGFSSFKLVVSPLQPGAVESNPVRDPRLSSHLPLEGIGSYLDLLNHNRRPAVPKVQDPDSYAVQIHQLHTYCISNYVYKIKLCISEDSS